jgi:uncharacterized protein YcfL
MKPIHILALVFLFAAGCSSNTNTLRLDSADQKRQFSQVFTQAYLAKNDSGDDDIVLVQDDIQPRHPDPSKPLSPDPSVMPRQMVHIRVFWTPMAGVKADHPANTNASIHWCFICQNGPQPGIIEYTGSGLVIVDKTATGATVTVRKAWMKQGCMRGQLCDPLGPCILKGRFLATQDPDQVKAVIAEIKAVSNSSEEAQASSPTPVN